MNQETASDRGVQLADIPHWINGGRVLPSRSREGAEIFNPATGEAIRWVEFADEAVADQALVAAAAAFPAWAGTAPPKRAQVLFRYRELLVKHRNRLAQLITEENGKTLAESRGELDRGIQVVEFAAGIPHLMKSEYLTDIASTLDGYSLREPLGVCLGITPFNFPGMVPMWMFPVAIAAGNSFILKPSEKDPSCAVELAALFEEAGLPNGVFNVVHGSRETVERFINAPEVAAVSFVGSTPVAHSVYKAASDAGKRAQCLGGAKNHAIVMPDADLSAACDAIMGAAFGCAGERCMAISVAVTVGEAGDKLAQLFKERVPKLKVGSGDDPATAIGPLVSEAHRERVAGYIETGLEEGARLIVDGREHDVPEVGFYLGASVFDHVTADMNIYQDEIFGTVLCMVRVDDLDEAIATVNGHRYANGAAIFTRSGAVADRFTREMQPGMLGVNVPVPAPTAFFGFGGHKSSLFGPLHIHGTDGVRFYTRTKAVTSRWPRSDAESSGPSGF